MLIKFRTMSAACTWLRREGFEHNSAIGRWYDKTDRQAETSIGNVGAPLRKRAIYVTITAALVLTACHGHESRDPANAAARLPDPPATPLLMSGERVHKVDAGQTPWKIAAIYNVAPKALENRNPGQWHVGQMIVIPAPKALPIRCEKPVDSWTDADLEACL